MSETLAAAAMWLLLNPLVSCVLPIAVAAVVWLYRNRLKEILP